MRHCLRFKRSERMRTAKQLLCAGSMLLVRLVRVQKGGHRLQKPRVHLGNMIIMILPEALSAAHGMHKCYTAAGIPPGTKIVPLFILVPACVTPQSHHQVEAVT
jgi:hypothetical protein